MNQYFVTGIGTGVGKTFVTSALLHQVPEYSGVKPVLSGFEMDDAGESDAGQLLAAMSQPITPETLDVVSPWRFAPPLSPHLAAAQEGKTIEPEGLIAWCRAQMAEHSTLLIEGVGGLMVPITPDWLVKDWMEELKLPVILISASYLGAINHTLLSIEALKQAGLSLDAVIVSESEDSAGLKDTCESIAPFLPHNAKLVPLPRQSSWKSAPPLLSLLS